MAKYFDENRNKQLYKASKNSNILVPVAKKFDNEKLEFQSKSGYVKMILQQQVIDGGSEACVLIICVKADKSEKQPGKVTVLHSEEWSFFSKYLNFIIKFYTIDGSRNSVETKRMQIAVNGDDKGTTEIWRVPGLPPPNLPRRMQRRK